MAISWSVILLQLGSVLMLVVWVTTKASLNRKLNHVLKYEGLESWSHPSQESWLHPSPQHDRAGSSFTWGGCYQPPWLASLATTQAHIHGFDLARSEIYSICDLLGHIKELIPRNHSLWISMTRGNKQNILEEFQWGSNIAVRGLESDQQHIA